MIGVVRNLTGILVVEKGGPGSGWYGPPKGTHVGSRIPFADDVSDNMRGRLTELLSDAKDTDFEGVIITTGIPKGYKSTPRHYISPKGKKFYGMYLYHKSTIYVHPNMANRIVSSVAMHELGHHVTVKKYLANKAPYDAIATNLKKRTSDIYTRFGLRRYSSSSGAEFLADAYTVYRSGKRGQAADLREFVQYVSDGEVDLNDMFGEP